MSSPNALNRNLPLLVIAFVLSLTSLAAVAQTVEYFQTGEEFAGPFPSWKNVKTDFGAKGDGKTDDAPAISAALTAIRTDRNDWCVLYFPAGTYLIKSTVLNTGRNDQDNMGMTIVGEDPATTRIVCSEDFNSSAIGQGAMFRLDGTYGNISRLMFDGKDKAKIGILRDGEYGSDWRLTDLLLQDLGVGIQWGGTSDKGQDLSPMIRCHFTRCAKGVTATNQNAMALFAWDCLFQDCGIGIDNGVGYVEAMRNVFLRSRECDIKGGQIGYAVLNNTSIDSRCFLGPINDMTVAMANGNRIYDTIDPVAMQGVNVMLDNVIRSRTSAGPALRMARSNTLCVGNTFTVDNPVQTAGSFFSADQKVVAREALPRPASVLVPGVPQNRHRKIFEVRLQTGADAREIQQQIDAAAKEPAGSNPVLHFPKGTYQLNRTIVLPALVEMQLVGDGGRGGATLEWTGAEGGVLFRLQGPSRATMRDFLLHSGKADAIHIENCDQVGGRILCDQVDCFGNQPETAADTTFVIDRVENSDITVTNQYIGCANSAVSVRGGPLLAAGGTSPGQISFLNGYIWLDRSPKFLNVTDGGRVLFCGYRTENSQRGALTLDSTSSGAITWACNNEGMPDYTSTPFVINGFNGTACVVANLEWVFQKVNAPSFTVSGDGSKCRLLAMCNMLAGGPDPGVPVTAIWKDTSNPPARALLANSQAIFKTWDWNALPMIYQGKVASEPDKQLVLDCLKQLRSLRLEPPAKRAAGVTDIKIFRVPIDVGKGRNGVVMRAGVN